MWDIQYNGLLFQSEGGKLYAYHEGARLSENSVNEKKVTPAHLLQATTDAII